VPRRSQGLAVLAASVCKAVQLYAADTKTACMARSRYVTGCSQLPGHTKRMCLGSLDFSQNNAAAQYRTCQPEHKDIAVHPCAPFRSRRTIIVGRYSHARGEMRRSVTCGFRLVTRTPAQYRSTVPGRTTLSIPGWTLHNQLQVPSQCIVVALSIGM
jgi:hypothetical protein